MSADPKLLQPPFRAMLRNKAKAVLTYYTPTPSPWRILGKIEGDQSAAEVWQKDGKWREDSTPCPLDIVAIEGEHGQLIAFAGFTLENA